MNPLEAEQLFDAIRSRIRSAAELSDLIARARTEGWKARGYESWEACCDKEFRPVITELEQSKRVELIGALHAAGLSLRVIGPVFGQSHEKVRQQLATVNDSPESSQVKTGIDDPALTGDSGWHSENGPGWRKEGGNWRPNPFPPSDAGLLAGTDWTPEPEPERPAPPPKPAPVMLTLRTHAGEEVPYPKPQSAATFNQSDGDGISWAKWSWNPVTGCLHGCGYCYARAIAARFTDAYPAGFTPLFHHERLDAPANTVIPAAHHGDPEWERVFVCSMADLYGRWVPDEWIAQVHAAMLASPRWQYILLTKFPDRYPGLAIPPGAWAGTSVDEQKRVRIAERAFRDVDAKVKWLSLEPLLEPLEFSDLSMFDWVVIGGQTATRQPNGSVAGFTPPKEWVLRITAQAKEAGCRVHWKPNLGNSVWYDEYPDSAL